MADEQAPVAVEEEWTPRAEGGVGRNAKALQARRGRYAVHRYSPYACGTGNEPTASNRPANASGIGRYH